MRSRDAASHAVLALALLPVAGNAIGTFLTEFWRPPRWLIGAALHAAAGVAAALVGIELMPRILPATPTWLLLVFFAVGAGLAFGLAKVAKWLCGFVKGGSAGAWMVYVAAAADLLGDGFMTIPTWRVSTPSHRSCARHVSPRSSAPIRPIRPAGASSRAAAIAWLAPLPPG